MHTAMRIFGKLTGFFISAVLTMLACFFCYCTSAQTCTSTVKPSINVSTNSTLTCAGKLVTFTATATNAGANPSFQWKVNNINAGINSSVFETTTLNNGDVVSCVVTADPTFLCATPTKAASFGISMQVSSALPPSISIVASANNVCPGIPIIFTASTQNTSSTLFYQWKLNEANISTDSFAYKNSSLENNDVVYCVLVDSSSCSVDPIASNKITVGINNLPSIIINPSDTSVAAGSTVKLNAVVTGTLSSYSWQPPENVSDPSSLSTITKPILSATNYFFNAVSTDGCLLNEKVTINILHELIMPNAFTPNGDGHNDVFKIPANTNVALQEFSIYNRWGNKVFSTDNVSRGWDGNVNGVKQAMGEYIYIIKGTGSKGKIVARGTFILVR